MPVCFTIYPNHANPNRRGIQLLELVISLTTASLLISGITSSIFLATKANQVAVNAESTMSRTQAGTNRLRNDLQEAKAFSARTATSATFTIADRNGDAIDETLSYSWPGAGKALRYSVNGTNTLEVTEPLNQFQLDWYSSRPQKASSIASFDPAGQYVFQSFSQNSAGDGGFFNNDSGRDLSIGLPGTYRSGDLLVAAIAVEGNQAGSITATAGWTKIFEVHKGNDVSLAAFYHFNPAGNNVSFAWSVKKKSYGVVAQFLPPSVTPSFGAFVTNIGTSSNPTAPAATATTNNPLVIRLLATRQSSVPEEGTNLPGHVPVLFRSRVLGSLAIGMATKSYPSSGAIPSVNFGLTSYEDFATATIVFKP